MRASAKFSSTDVMVSSAGGADARVAADTAAKGPGPAIEATGGELLADGQPLRACRRG